MPIYRMHGESSVRKDFLIEADDEDAAVEQASCGWTEEYTGEHEKYDVIISCVSEADPDDVKTIEYEKSRRQDKVDNEIHLLLCKLTDRELEWDIEMIGQIREAIQEVLSFNDIMTPEEFYP